MTIKKTTKLSLRKQTLRTLSPRGLETVRGGEDWMLVAGRLWLRMTGSCGDDYDDASGNSVAGIR